MRMGGLVLFLSFVLGICVFLWTIVGRYVIIIYCSVLGLVYLLHCFRTSIVESALFASTLSKNKTKKYDGRGKRFFLSILDFRQWLFFSFVGFFIAGIAVTISSFRTYFLLCPDDVSLDRVVFLIRFGWQQCHRPDVITGDFVVIDRGRIGRFVVRDENGRRYSLQGDFRLLPGDRVWLSARVSYPWTIYTKPIVYPPFVSAIATSQTEFLGEYTFDYAQWLVMKSIVGTIRPSSLVLITSDKFSLIERIQRSVFHRLDLFFSDDFARGLYAGLLIGDIADFLDTEYQTFVDAGLIHLVAVSGGNIMMLLMLLTFFFRFFPLYPGLFIKGLIVIGYVVICGGDTSIIRAGIMTIIGLIALGLGRDVHVFRLIALARVVMVCFNPLVMVADLGFLLSFFALTGIIIIDKICRGLGWFHHSWGGSAMREYVLPCVGASLGVAPLLLFFMGQWNILGLFVNIVLAPFVPLGMMMSIIATSIASWSWVAAFLSPIMTTIAQGLLWLGEWTQMYGIRLIVLSWSIKWILLIIGIGIHCFFIWFLLRYQYVLEGEKQTLSGGSQV